MPAVDGATLDAFIVTPLVAEPQGELWFGFKDLHGSGGVGHYSPSSSGGRWEIHLAHRGEEGLTSGFVLTLNVDEKGDVWVGTLGGGLAHYARDDGVWHRIEVPSMKVTAILPVDGLLWLGTFGGGLVGYDPDTGQQEAFTRESTGGGLVDDEITVLLADGKGGLWIGTHGGGLSYFDVRRQSWTPYEMKGPRGDVRALAMDTRGHLWVGTFGGGVLRYDPVSGGWLVYTRATTDEALTSDHVVSLLTSPDGDVWVALSDMKAEGGVAHFDGRLWRSHTRENTGGGLASNDVRTLAFDGRGGLWVGTREGGLSRLDLGRSLWERLTIPDTARDQAGDTVLALAPDGEGGMWVGTAVGLRHVRPGGEP